MNKYNLSVHPIEGMDLAPFIGVNLPNEANALVMTIREILLHLPYRESLLRGEAAEVVLPGLSAAAAIFLAEWHGQFGNWPSIRWAVKKEEGGFAYPPTAMADLNEVRANARIARSI